MSSEIDDFADELQKRILDEMREVYSEKVVELFLHPKNFGKMELPDGQAKFTGPCGDTMYMFLRITKGVIREAKFITDGCGTTIACGGMLTEMVKGKIIEEAEAISDLDILNILGGLPDEDKHCALLAANTLKAAIADYRKSRREPWKRIYRKQ